MIPPKQVQDILDAARIEDVVGEFVTLKRRGVNLIGLCPFHHEKTPSFNVNPARNIFKCFGCGKGGDSVAFLREQEKMTYLEALRWLARKYSIEIQEVERTPEQLAQIQQADSLYIVNDFALQHFQQQLFETDEGKSVALSYFKKRGLREETIRNFGLGYAPDERDLLLKRARSAGHDLELIKKVGLCSQDGGRDFFRGRVMFAIHNLSGKVAAFAGRTMSSDKTVPKYVNSPETEIYIKNKSLYGLFQARNAIRKYDECILVEGYMDVISLHQANIENVVASSGTSLTEGQVSAIRRFTDKFILLYDGDLAGQKATHRGTDLSLADYGIGVSVKIVKLPQGEDPDSFVVNQGGEALKEYINSNAVDYIIYRIEQIKKESEGDPNKRLTIVNEIAKTIALVHDAVKRSIYTRLINEKFGISEYDLGKEIEKLIKSEFVKKDQKAARQPEAASDSVPFLPGDEWPSEMPPMSADGGDLPSGFPAPRKSKESVQERDIIRLLVQFGNRMLEQEKVTVAEFILADIEDSLGTFEQAIYGRIATECFELVKAGKTFDQHYFIQHEAPEVCELAIDLLSEPWDYSPNWEAKWNYPLQNQKMPDLNFDLDMKQALVRFKLQKVMAMCEMNLARVKAASLAGDDESMFRYMKTQQKLNETRNALALQAGTIVLPK